MPDALALPHALVASGAVDGSLAVAVPVAVAAGLVSFFSPCVLPLLPAYFSYATGLSGADLAAGDVRRGRLLAGAVLFVLGFTVVFVLLGVAGGGLGGWLVLHRRTLEVVLGVVTLVLGAAFLGLVPWLQRDVRVHRVPAVGLAAAPLLGFLFGVGWTPCVGPTLSLILGLALTEGDASRGGLLLACYALGLGVPFVLASLAWRRALATFGWVRRHQAWVMRTGGVLMLVVGLALLSGWWAYSVAWVQIHLPAGWQL